MAGDSEGSRFDAKQLGSANSGYSMYAASMDSTLQALFDFLRTSLGGGARGGIMGELGLLSNAISGLGNNSLSAQMSVNAGLRRYGAVGIGESGQYGSVGGADIVTSRLGAALYKDTKAAFSDPITGLPSGAAAGLNHKEFGQAMGLTMQLGKQYAGGAIASGVDSGTPSLMIENFKAEVGKTAALLQSVKGFLGSGALENLNRTMTDLFGGGGLQAMGTNQARAELLRMQSFSNLVSPENPMAAFNFLSDGVGRGITQAFAPGMSPQEANYRYRGIATPAMLDLSLAAYKGATQSGAIAGRSPEDRFVRRRGLEDIAQARVDVTGQIAREEEELAVASFVSRMQGGEARKEYENLAQRLVEAGSDNVAVANARGALGEYVQRRSGRSVGQHDLLGIYESEGVQYDIGREAYRMTSTRSGQATGRMLETNSRLLGMTPEQARVAGAGFANLSVADQAGMLNAVDGRDTEAIREMMRGSAGAALRAAGINERAFESHMTGGMMTREKLERAARLAETSPHFVSAGELVKGREELFTQTIKGLTGARRDPDLLDQIVAGMSGEPTVTDGQVLRSLVDDGKRGLNLSMAKGEIENTKANRDAISEEVGFPVDLSSKEGQMRALAALQKKGVVSVEQVKDKDGNKTSRMLYGTHEQFSDKKNEMTNAMKGDGLDTIAKAFGVKEGFKEAWNKLDKDDKTNEAYKDMVRSAMGGENAGANFKKAYADKLKELKGGMSKEDREKVQRELEALGLAGSTALNEAERTDIIEGKADKDGKRSGGLRDQIKESEDNWVKSRDRLTYLRKNDPKNKTAIEAQEKAVEENRLRNEQLNGIHDRLIAPEGTNNVQRMVVQIMEVLGGSLK
jgi:hypothetical protein